MSPVTRTARVRVVLRLALVTIAAAALLDTPAAVSAHAEIVSTTPSDGATVEGGPPEVVVTFSEGIATDSTLELRDEAGATVATGGLDPADPTSLRLANPPLEPGTYEGRVVWFSADGHGPERATFRFTVVAPPSPTPSPTPSATAAATASPAGPSAVPSPAATAVVSPAATPTPSPGPADPEPTSADVVVPIAVALVAIAALGAWLIRGRTGRRA